MSHHVPHIPTTTDPTRTSSCTHCGLIPGRTYPALHLCGRCQTSYYCSRKCWTKDWARHGPICRPPPANAPLTTEDNKTRLRTGSETSKSTTTGSDRSVGGVATPSSTAARTSRAGSRASRSTSGESSGGLEMSLKRKTKMGNMKMGVDDKGKEKVREEWQ